MKYKTAGLPLLSNRILMDSKQVSSLCRRLCIHSIT
eukprot:UN22675